MKRLAIAGATLLIVLSSAAPVLAQGARGRDNLGVPELVNQVQRNENQASRTAQRQGQDLTHLKSMADKAISQRIATLNSLLTRIQNDSRLDAGEKSALSADVQTDISGLTSLKAKIDADSDLASARADAKNIVTNFRIYAMFAPKMRLLITIDNLQAMSNRIGSLVPKLQSLTDNLKSQGKDTSKIQSLIDDIKNQLSSISSELSVDKSTVMGVTVSTQNPQAIFTQVRKDLASVRAAFAQIRHDVGQMREQFRIVLHGQGSTSSTSASPR